MSAITEKYGLQLPLLLHPKNHFKVILQIFYLLFCRFLLAFESHAFFFLFYFCSILVLIYFFFIDSMKIHSSIMIYYFITSFTPEIFSLLSLSCTLVYPMSCSCVQKMRRRLSTSWALDVMSRRSLCASLLASSPSPLRLEASTSASSWTHSYGGYKRTTLVFRLPVKHHLLNHPAVD